MELDETTSDEVLREANGRTARHLLQEAAHRADRPAHAPGRAEHVQVG